MKIVIIKDGIFTTYEAVTGIKLGEDNLLRFNYSSRFKTSPEDDVNLQQFAQINLDDSVSKIEFIKD